MIVEPPSTTVPALGVDDGGAEDRLHVDAVVEVEAAVLDRDGRVADVWGHLRRARRTTRSSAACSSVIRLPSAA